MLLNQDAQYTPGREARWKEGNDLIISYLKRLQPGGKLKVLDVGCGEGYNYRILTNQMARIQLSEDALEYYAIDENPKLAPLFKHTKVRFTIGNVNNLKHLYPERFFDVVIASEIIEHTVTTDMFILGIKHILSDHGRVFLTTPNLGSWHSIISLILGYQPLSTEISCIRSEFGKLPMARRYYQNNILMHLRAFTYRGLIEFLRYHGFYIEKTFGGGYKFIDKILFTKIFAQWAPVLKVIIKKNDI